MLNETLCCFLSVLLILRQILRDLVSKHEHVLACAKLKTKISVNLEIQKAGVGVHSR